MKTQFKTNQYYRVTVHSVLHSCIERDWPCTGALQVLTLAPEGTVLTALFRPDGYSGYCQIRGPVFDIIDGPHGLVDRHSPEPWKIVTEGVLVRAILDRDGRVVAKVHVYDDADYANSERLVNCVNLFSGVHDSALKVIENWGGFAEWARVNGCAEDASMTEHYIVK